MRKPIHHLIAGMAVLSLPAYARDTQIDDVAYIGAARCQGLFDSGNLSPKVDPKSIDRFMAQAGSGRSDIVLDQARDARNAASREAANAGAEEKARLVAERDGPCRQWSGAPGKGAAPSKS